MKKLKKIEFIIFPTWGIFWLYSKSVDVAAIVCLSKNNPSVKHQFGTPAMTIATRLRRWRHHRHNEFDNN